jgi:hypothetical protein
LGGLAQISFIQKTYFDLYIYISAYFYQSLMS